MKDKSKIQGLNLVLIGYRAVGKTSIGRCLAARWQRPFVDLDELLEQEAGETIPQLVARAGWPEFRRREKELVARFANAQGLILATGGGVVLDPENVAHLRTGGLLVWLRARPETIRRRLARDNQQLQQRPGLTSQGTLAEIEAVLAQRLPLYQAAADFILEVDELSPEEAAARITAWFRSRQPDSCQTTPAS